MFTVRELFAFLDALSRPAELPELTAVLGNLDVGRELDKHMLFSNRGYTRNPVHNGPYSQALVLCWKNGQRSPIHDHTGSNCGVRVLRGVLTETLFEFAPNGHIKAVASRDCPPGSVLASRDLDLHQVSNLQAGDAELVTLHVYSPPLQLMGTYSLTDTARGTEPMLVEYSEAAGI